jgi:23S rRNA (adenine2503-C2)-methyltransferase
VKVIAKTGREDIATVYLAETAEGKLIEFAESLQPPLPIQKKWVITISTLYGCPVGCRFCDAGGWFEGRISKDTILAQIDYLVKNRFPAGEIPVEKFKIQFARMGEPAFNPSVLDVLESLPARFDAPGMVISFSTIAPRGTDKFFKTLADIKKKHYPGKFQFQFSLHTTDTKLRDWLIPIKKWEFEKMSDYGKSLSENGDKKITLNFAWAAGMPVDPDTLVRYFPPDRFLLKVTPVNPTYQAAKNKIPSVIPHDDENNVFTVLRTAGYEVIISIGALEENYIGSNCGQYITAYKKYGEPIAGGYRYDFHKFKTTGESLIQS